MRECLWMLAALLLMGCEEQVKRFTWRNVGPGGGGWIQSISMDPKRIYAGTGGNGLFIGTWE